MKQHLLAAFFLLTFAVTVPADDLKTVDSFRDAADKAKSLLTLPDWEQTPEAVEAATKKAIATANAALDQIGSQDLSKVTFKSTIVALDDLGYQAASPRARRPSSRRRTRIPPCGRRARTR